MAYTPPVGTANLSIGSVLGYTPPTGTVALSLGHTDSSDRAITFAGVTPAPTGLLQLFRVNNAALSGVTAPPTGLLSLRRVNNAVLSGVTRPLTGLVLLRKVNRVALTGGTRAPTGRVQAGYDSNLLSDLHALAEWRWQEGAISVLGNRARVHETQST